jgi:hypothetical protein
MEISTSEPTATWNFPRFPVTVSSGAARVSIRGPGIETPLTCSDTCALFVSNVKPSVELLPVIGKRAGFSPNRSHFEADSIDLAISFVTKGNCER